MRLAGTRWSPIAFTANLERHGEFVRLAEIHLADLRSQLEGLAIRAEPGDYRDARRVELRLGWLVRYLRDSTTAATPPGAEWPVIIDTTRRIRTFLRQDASLKAAMAWADKFVAPPQMEDAVDLDAFWMERMTAQERLLESSRKASQSPRGILFDIDGDVAVQYFALDAELAEALPAGMLE